MPVYYIVRTEDPLSITKVTAPTWRKAFIKWARNQKNVFEDATNEDLFYDLSNGNFPLIIMNERNFKSLK